MSMHGYDAWRCSAPDDDYPEYDPNEQEDEDYMEEPHDNVQAVMMVIKNASARELRLLTAAVTSRREQLERELKAELSELGNVDKAPRAPRSPNAAPRSDKGKPRTAKNGELPGEVQP